MSVTRTVVLGVSGGALAVWLAAAATTAPRPAGPVALPRPSSPDLHGDELNAEIARLHERLRPTVAPMQSRDLFRYSGTGATSLAQPALAMPAAVAAPPPAPALKLIGIAEDVVNESPVRTAMLSAAGGELVFAKEGDTVPPQFRVTRVSPEVVELTDTVTGSVLRLALR
ncbi:MAG: hypothetical protein DMF89_16640 [Acidobacteria bacterium]|nr:MAG: hypothetical protein DMF89_16640 [Acidobacteriota bacterium]